MSTNDPLYQLGSIWYHSEALEVPYYPKQYLGRDFFATSYSKAALMPVFCIVELVYGTFGTSNKQGTLDFCPDKSGRN